MRNKIKTASSVVIDKEENDNPENAFSKLMMIPQTVDPVRQCKMLLESMKEELTFEKNMFYKTCQEEIPRSVSLDREKRENFQNYERLLDYSKKKKNIEDFQRKSCRQVKVQVKKTRAKSLKEFVQQKKTRLLTEQNQSEINKNRVESILRDQKARQKLFDESILIERLYFIKREQNKKQADLCPVPRKFRGLDPKHMRVPEPISDEKTFYRRKYVHNQKTFQYFRKALQTENTLLKNKQKENSLVITNLMNHFKDTALLTNQNDIGEQVNQCIRRLFLAYANSGSEDVSSMYKEITRENMYKLMDDFQLDYKDNEKIQKIIQENVITEFYFLEIIHLLSIKKEKQFFSDTNQFFLENIVNKPEIYLPKEWQIYNNKKNFIQKHLKVRKFNQKIQQIYSSVFGSKKVSEYLNFDEMVQVMWMLKIYPFMISKKTLRFFYLYSQIKETGITITNIVDIYVLIAISREGEVEDNLKQIVEIVLNYSKNQLTQQ